MGFTDENGEDILITIVREHAGDYEAKNVASWSKAYEKWQKKGAPESGESGDVSKFINVKDFLA